MKIRISLVTHGTAGLSHRDLDSYDTGSFVCHHYRAINRVYIRGDLGIVVKCNVSVITSFFALLWIAPVAQESLPKTVGQIMQASKGKVFSNSSGRQHVGIDQKASARRTSKSP